MKSVILFFYLLGLSIPVFAQESVQKAYKESYRSERAGDFKGAISSLMSIYQTYPKGYTLNLRLGWLFFLRGQHANSMYHYERAIKVYPNSLEAKLAYSLPLLKLGKWSKAERTLDEVLKKDFYNFYGNLRMAIVLRITNKPELALKVLQRILYFYPTQVLVLIEWAKLNQDLGRPEKAKEIWRDILVLDPLNQEAALFFQKNPTE